MNFGISIVGIISLAAAIWVIYDVITNNKQISSGVRILWIVFAIVFSIITAVVYFLVYKIKKV